MSEIDIGKRGGRTANLELNLVPFIDLMSVLITFLLITAVWSQVSMIQIGNSIMGKKNEEQTTPPTTAPINNFVLRLEVRPTGYVLQAGREDFNYPINQTVFETQALAEQLKVIKQAHPEHNDAFIMITNDLPYEELIRAMDVILKAGFLNVQFGPAEPG